MEVKVLEDRAELNLPNSVDLKQLTELIALLCRAHADLTGQKHPSGEPLFFSAGLPLDAFTSPDLALVLSIRNPTLGCVSTTVLPGSIGQLAQIIGAHLSKLALAGAAHAAVAERQVSGASIQ